MSDDSFDFARYFDRVQHTPIWHQMQLEMVRYAGVQVGDRVIDVGTGPGRLVYELEQEGIAAVGVDADWCVLERLRDRYPRGRLVAGLGERLPFPDDFFDAAVAGNILFFLKDPLAALTEMVRVVRPGGAVVNWSPSERMSASSAHTYVADHPELEPFEQKHLVNWALVAEGNRRWDSDDLRWYFETARLTDFESKTTLDGLARYGRGRVPEVA